MRVVRHPRGPEPQPHHGLQAVRPARPGGAGAPVRPDPAAAAWRRVGNIAEAKPEALQLMWMPEKAGKYELEVR